MSARPYVLLSVAASLDGYIDDAGRSRLLLSNDEDFARVDAERAGVDAILVGANTVRSDNPRLLVRSEELRRERVARGLPADPMKVTITGSGRLDPAANFFTLGDAPKVVYALSPAVGPLSERLGSAALVVDAGDPLDVPGVLADLVERGVQRLMVEGGSTIHTLFLSGGLVDELQLVFAPVFVADPQAPRFVNPGFGLDGRMTLAEVRQIGDCVLLRYLPKDADD
jgi:5-amino-6-(5-phosphoribosylamino)uracil reductase